MPAAMFAALFFTVALLVTTAYFIMGSIPLLVLKHDTPLDSRFIRGLFNVYYTAVMFTSTVAAASYGFYVFAGFYGIQRFLWEFLKPYPPVIGPLNIFHLICIVLVGYSLFMMRQQNELRAAL